jgi:hypothetical protein
MPICECGCEGETTGTFCPGHDQKLQTELEKRVGGLLNFRDLVETVHVYKNRQISCEGLCKAIMKILDKK